jgi:hypothetical protein
MRRFIPVVLLLLVVLTAAGWTWPVRGPVLEAFSFDPAHPYGAGQHRGIAIGADAGAPVLAPAAGVVTFAGTVPTSGKTLTIETPGGLAVTLTHLGSLAVARDANVEEGAVVGTVGPSGTAEFDVPYVHLGIRTASEDQGYLDPLRFLPATAAPAPAPPAPAPAPAPPPPVVVVAAPPPPSSPATAPPPAQAAPAPAVPVPAVPASAPAAAAPAPAAAPEQAPAALPGVPLASPAAVEQPGLVLGHRPLRTLSARPPAAVAARPGAAPLRPARRARPVAGSSVPAMPAPARAAVRVTLPPAVPPPAQSAVGPTPAPSRAHLPAALLAAVLAALAAVGAVGVAAVRMISGPSPTVVEASSEQRSEEDPRRTGLALREWAAPYRPRGRLRRAGGRVRALPPLEGRRRLDGERDGRARHAGDGLRRPERRLPA